MLVLPMDQPGVEVRPLHQMTGVAHFNEVFLDGARVPSNWVVGTEGDGWRMAVALLAHERSSIGRGGGRKPGSLWTPSGLARSTGRPTTRWSGRTWPGSTPDHNHPVAERATGHPPSIPKLWRSHRDATRPSDRPSRFSRWHGVARRPNGCHRTGSSSSPTSDHWAYGICDSRALSLGGGTDEVQRNTLGERVLGLPGNRLPTGTSRSD
ncbi:MAG: hypothetical protein Ct9H300mP12_07770 [Acidimicrobiales bacterium]|nr:MAG: hypothetical protein Ct9H300mP12_07770 [Acidimicrobiales bacterium]